MATIGDTLPHCTGTGTQADPYIFEDVYGFVEAIDVVDAYVEAATPNIVWNCNTDTSALTCPIIIKCLEIQAKGLTIINALVQNQDVPVFLIYKTTRTNDQKIYNLNAYNVCIINYDYGHSLLNDNCRYSEQGSGVVDFYNCNFAGICRGYSNASYDGHNDKLNFIGHITGNRYQDTMRYNMHNCTFNFNMKDPTNTASKNFIVHGDGMGYYSQSYLYLDNCTVCFSGTVSWVFMIAGTYANNTTFQNNQSNALTCNTLQIKIEANAGLSGYNYHKMYITATSGGNAKDAKGLWNISRNTFTNVTRQGILMQETDPTTADYIYDEQNLANAGFLVGEVIV